MPIETERISIATDQGGTASYVIVPWGGGFGFCMMRRLAPLLGAAVSLIKGVSDSKNLAAIKSKGESGEIKNAKGVLDMDLAVLFSGLTNDISDNLSGVMTSVATAIANEGDVELIHLIFTGITRTCDGVLFALSNTHEFDQAFQVNYGEMMRAVIAVLKINYWPSIQHLLAKGKK